MCYHKSNNMTIQTNSKFELKHAVSYILTHKVQIVLAAIVLLGLSIRLLGITWGFSTKGPVMVFHPDEGFALMVMNQMHVKPVDFNPEGAHSEGTFYYYVTGGAYLIYKSGATLAARIGLPTLAVSHSAELVLVGRLVSIMAGALSIFLLYHVVRAANLSKTAGLLAALFVAIYPIDVIYSQFMRPHILANTLLIFSLLVLFLKTSTKANRFKYALVGILLGLSTATRYNMAITLIIPALYIFIDSVENKRTFLQIIFNVDYVILGVSFIFGVFLGDPYLFLKYSEMSYYLHRQSTFVPPHAFALNNLADITYPLRYITYLIPESGKPFLAVGIYLSVFFALLRKSRLKLALPLNEEPRSKLTGI